MVPVPLPIFTLISQVLTTSAEVMAVPSDHLAAGLSLTVISVIPSFQTKSPSASRGSREPSMKLYMYSVSNIMVRLPMACAVHAMALFWLVPMGFHVATVPHCWPAKYSVSLRGSSATVSALAPKPMVMTMASARIRAASFLVFIVPFPPFIIFDLLRGHEY